MKEVVKGDAVAIHSYKHDGNIHRAWKRVIVLDVGDDFIITANEKTRVIESDGRTWYTREPAVIYFFKEHWFNIIGMVRDDGIYYYCNISSPYIVEDKTVKYIDYDLDLKVFPDGVYRILDEEEYQYHKKEKGYSQELDNILKSELDFLITMVRNEAGPFSKGVIEHWYNVLKQQQKV